MKIRAMLMEGYSSLEKNIWEPCMQDPPSTIENVNDKICKTEG
mgnify:CR=1 FL=1